MQFAIKKGEKNFRYLTIIRQIIYYVNRTETNLFMFKKILVALDGSSISEKALYTAIQEAELRNAELHAVYVIQHIMAHQMMIDPSTGAADTSPELINEILATEAQKVLTNAKDISGEKGIDIILHKSFGDPREGILALSEEIGADLIVLGTKGKTNLERLLLGSVSSAVVMNSKITTLLVKME